MKGFQITKVRHEYKFNPIWSDLTYFSGLGPVLFVGKF